MFDWIGRTPLRKTRRGWHWSLRTWAKAAAAAIAGICAVYGYARAIEPRWLQWKRQTIPLGGLPRAFDGYRILQISDLHLADGRALTPTALRTIVARANRLRPDLIVITGDFISAIDPVSLEGLATLSALKAPDGVAAILGNHDYWHGLADLRAALDAAGIPLLMNTHRVILRGAEQEQLVVAGIDDAWDGKPDISGALTGLGEDAFAILLAHEPNFAVEAVRDGRVRLQLSGHTHGGQIRIPMIGPIVLPDLGYLYPQGLYRVTRRAGPPLVIYTNRGIGVAEIPLRLFCRPEITLITLRRTVPDQG